MLASGVANAASNKRVQILLDMSGSMAATGSGGVTRVEIGIISEDTQLKDWYRQFGFVQTGTKAFDHLPFVVAFMAKEL